MKSVRDSLRDLDSGNRFFGKTSGINNVAFGGVCGFIINKTDHVPVILTFGINSRRENCLTGKLTWPKNMRFNLAGFIVEFQLRIKGCDDVQVKS